CAPRPTLLPFHAPSGSTTPRPSPPARCLSRRPRTLSTRTAARRQRASARPRTFPRKLKISSSAPSGRLPAPGLPAPPIPPPIATRTPSTGWRVLLVGKEPPLPPTTTLQTSGWASSSCSTTFLAASSGCSASRRVLLAQETSPLRPTTTLRAKLQSRDIRALRTIKGH
ncbi:hypothetical protein T484DRAFT_1915463, partial [Baffinella frigidus]